MLSDHKDVLHLAPPTKGDTKGDSYHSFPGHGTGVRYPADQSRSFLAPQPYHETPERSAGKTMDGTPARYKKPGIPLHRAYGSPPTMGPGILGSRRGVRCSPPSGP